MDLLERLNVNVGGVCDRRVYRAVWAGAAAARNPVFLLARRGAKTAGLALATIHSAAYWRSFLVWHPRLGVTLLPGEGRMDHMNENAARGHPPLFPRPRRVAFAAYSGSNSLILSKATLRERSGGMRPTVQTAS